MANEAVLMWEYSPKIPFTVADNTGIAKGAVVKMADAFTASLAAATDDMAGGITGSEKIADDGHVTLGIYRGGIFKVYASGSVSVGDPLGSVANAPNHFASNKDTGALSGSSIFGIALEDATTAQTFLMELRPQCHNF